MLIDNKYMYIHIPRTGGRYISQLFIKNNYKCDMFKFENNFHDKIKNKKIHVPHLEYPYFLNFIHNKNILNFTVVRDPVDRFKSILKGYYGYYNKDMDKFNKKIKEIFLNFNEYVNSKIVTEQANWHVPQINFIGSNTEIWFYEKGLGKNFIKWLYKKYGFTFSNIENINYDKGYYDDIDIDIILTKKQIKSIKDYYFKDYKIIYG
tara:strand:- start:81 stop:698 length:618 start_codon:yes stop_codon:yes gene_type:complete